MNFETAVSVTYPESSKQPATRKLATNKVGTQGSLESKQQIIDLDPETSFLFHLSVLIFFTDLLGWALLDST